VRIIGGQHKGRRLQAPKGKNVRPTSAAIREAVFNVLSQWDPSPIHNGLVLDLFAGTGALGLEALSRGARQATFVESHPEAAATIRANINLLGEERRTRLITQDVLRLPSSNQSADLVFLDPPYGLNLMKKAVRAARNSRWVTANSLLVMEMAATDEIVEPEEFCVLWVRIYGQTQVIISKLAV